MGSSNPFTEWGERGGVHFSGLPHAWPFFPSLHLSHLSAKHLFIHLSYFNKWLRLQDVAGGGGALRVHLRDLECCMNQMMEIIGIRWSGNTLAAQYSKICFALLFFFFFFCGCLFLGVFKPPLHPRLPPPAPEFHREW